MNKQQSIYASLNVCQCEFDKNLPQKQKTFNDLGNATENFLNIYLPANAGFVSAMSDTIYPRNRPFYVPNIPTITLGVNYGVIAYLFKKAEGQSDDRAAGEATLEFIASWQGGNLGGYATQKLATKAASRFGIAMAGRILGGAVGSVIPVGGTIIGAVAGAWLANKVEEWWFSDEDKALESAQAENERIAQLEKAYLLKINRINDYLIRNNYVELRELDKDIFGNPLAHSNEAETLCKEASNLQSSYFKTILLMLSFPQYLDRKQEEEEKEQRKQERKIQPVKDAILLTLDIEKCIDTSKAELLKEKEIYIYNERFKRVVAKSKSDDKGRLCYY